MAAVSLAASLASHGAEVVETTFATRDVVVAESVLGPSAAEADFAPVLQKTVDEVAKLGGGVVFLRAGRYRFSAPVTVRRGVTVRGDYSAARPSAGTVVEIVGGRGEEEGPAAFSLENGAGLVGLLFYYPEQKLSAPAAYPWTVRTALEGRAGNNQTVMDCTFVNSWQALRIGPESNECHTFRRLGICALKTGFLVDMTTDIGRITDVVVSPEVWAKSGFPGAPAKQKVEEFLKSSGATGAGGGSTAFCGSAAGSSGTMSATGAGRVSTAIPNLPQDILSPGFISAGESIFFPFTKVPFVLPRSSIVHLPSLETIFAWRRESPSAATGAMELPISRPIVISAPSG